MRIERDQVDLRAAAERLDRGAAGVARGRTTMVVRSPRCASAWSISRARNCIARSLKASVGPWNSSSTKVPGAELRQRRDRRMAERAVGLVRHARRGRRPRSCSPTNGRDHLAGDLGVRPPGQARRSASGEKTGQVSGT